MVRGSGGCLACPDNRSFVSLGTRQLADRDRTCYLCRLWERARATEIREGRSRGHSRSISGSLFRFGFSPLSNRLDSYILFVSSLFLCQIRRVSIFLVIFVFEMQSPSLPASRNGTILEKYARVNKKNEMCDNQRRRRGPVSFFHWKTKHNCEIPVLV